MLKKLFLLCLTSIPCFLFSQDVKITEVSESETAKGDVPYAVIENVPVYPGCESEVGNNVLKSCMSTKIAEFINKNFNIKKIEALNLPPKIYRTSVQFKIDKSGKVVDVYARADHPEIEKEAIRVVSNIPEMIPGKQRGEAVGVLYSLPIIFKITTPEKQINKKKRKKSKN